MTSSTIIILVVVLLMLGAVAVLVIMRKRAPQEEELLYYVCGSCRRKLRYRPKQIGHKGVCPRCKAAFVFPANGARQH